MARPIKRDDRYRDMLLKNMPSEIVAFYIAVLGVIASASAPGWLIWVVFVIGLVATPLWLIFGQSVTSWYQNTLAAVAFPIWDMTLPTGAFATIPGWKPVIGSVFLLIFTMLVAPLVSMIFKPK